jgi:nucleoside-diphosphate-sugar epimerase
MKPSVRKILVTGATGFLGRRLVAELVEKGYPVRAFSRKPFASDWELLHGVEAVCGDVADAASLKPAFESIEVVVHAAADTSGTEEGAKRCTIQGTRNIIDLSREFGVKKIIYISSLNVYGVADLRENSVADEEASIEEHPEKRGFYTWGKLEAEKLALEAMRKNLVPIVCLRPGTILGPGGEVFTPMMGLSAGNALFFVIGMGDFVMPLVYIDNLVDAIIAAIESEETGGRIFNLVDPDTVSKKEYVERLLKKLYPKAGFVFIPYGIFHFAVCLQEKLLKFVGKKPFLTCYRLTSSQRNIIYDSSRIRRALNWSPPYTMDDAFAALISHSREKARES